MMLRMAFTVQMLLFTGALCPGVAVAQPRKAPAKPAPRLVLVEAEQFAELGGWDLDTQSMDQMGSPYLLAHGLGVPVKDAVTTVTFPASGRYAVWVRTRDWVAPWKAPGAPGRFQVLVNGKPLATTFGVEGAAWHWQHGGTVDVSTKSTLALHDLTGFEGRCDAILFASDPAFTPPNEKRALAAFRSKALGIHAQPQDGGKYDLVVVGGGIAGTCAALSGARNGLKVALIQDRPVLGGNGSSEVRVWPEGKTRLRPYRHIGDLVEEILVPKSDATKNAGRAEVFGDKKKRDTVESEPRITLLTEYRMNGVTVRGGAIESIVAQHVRSGRRIRVTGRVFADCTGDANLGFLAGADYEVSKEGVMGATNLWNLLNTADTSQVLMCECKDKDALTISVRNGNVAAPFPRCPWALDLTNKPFPGRKSFKGQWANQPLTNLGGWFWEGGFDKDMVNDIELIRDSNLRAMYGAWDALKNIDHLYPNHRLGWAAFIAGKRESRRLIGDLVLTGDDFRKSRAFPDGCFPCTWHIDVHTADPKFSKEVKGQEFIAQATTGKDYDYQGPYWAPYRCLYSRNIGNLFMAGRDISVNHEALGPVRVMRTCGMMGEIVGKAAWICVSQNTTPRGVYESHLPLLKELMTQPGVGRRADLNGPLAIPPGASVASFTGSGIDPATLEGIVVDDSDALLTGRWSDTGSLTGFVGDGYRYSSDDKASARYTFHVPKSGVYEIRVNWLPHENRAHSAHITIQTAEGEKTVQVDQTKAPGGPKGFESLGTFRFDRDTPGAVTFLVAGAAGVVHIDAVQIVPRHPAP